MIISYKPEDVPVSLGSKRTVTIWRPIIPVILTNNNKLVGYEALVDSGADHNIFHGAIASILGVKLTSGKSRKIHGLSGGPIKGYVHTIIMKVFDFKPFPTSVIFSNQMPDNAMGVLGNVGFFDKFDVNFSYRNKQIDIRR